MNLTRYRWVEYKPDLGNNRELDAPLTLEVRTGLTRGELAAFGEGLTKAQMPVLKVANSKKSTLKELRAVKESRDAAVLAIISANVRLKGKHTIDSQPLETMAQYISFCESLPAKFPMHELLSIVPKLNTVAEDEAVFSERLSGGLATTPRRSAANKTSPTEGR